MTIKLRTLPVLVIAVALLSGCAGPRYRTAKGFASYFNTAKTVAVMPLDVKINSLSAGGVPELRDDWTTDAKVKVKTALQESFNSFPHLQLVFLDEDSFNGADQDLLREQMGMFNAIFASIVTHTYDSRNIFPHKLKNFDYTFGPDISHLSSLMAADAFLFCSGSNYLWTGGRVGLGILSALASAALTNQVILPASGPEWITLSLVDAHTGDIIWFDYIPQQGDLRNADLDLKLVKNMLRSLPSSTK